MIDQVRTVAPPSRRRLHASHDVTISRLVPGLEEAWNEFVERSSGATPFHELQWMRAVRDVYGHRPHYLVARSDPDKTVRAVLPLFEVNGPFTGRALVSVPYAVYGGVASESPEAADALYEEARSLAQELGVRYLELREGRDLPGFEQRCHHYTFRKRLPDRPEDVLPSFPRKARAAVRKAMNEYKLTAKFGHELIDEFFHLYAVSLRRLASPPHDKQFLERLRDEYGERCIIQVVYKDNTPVAGCLSLQFRNQMLPYFAGIDDGHSAMNTSNYLYFRLMEYAVERGSEIFDFGRTRQDNIGGCQFKTNQGFEPEPLPYAFFSPDGAAPPDLRPSNRKFSLAQAVWKRMPLTLVSRFGSRVTHWLP